jgi:hypothetical protein
MSRLFLSLCIWVLFISGVLGQTTDPTKIAELQRRFKEGQSLVAQNKPEEALKVFEGIIREEPKARGSLLLAGTICVDLQKFPNAEKYLDVFHELEPKDFRGIIFSIQTAQALKKTAKAEALRKELYDLRSKGGTISGLTDKKLFIREKVPGEKDSIIIFSEFFNYKEEPYRLWQAEQISKEGAVMRHLVFFFNDEATKALRAKDPLAKDVDLFALGEYVLRNGEVTDVNLYQEEAGISPSYSKCRDWMLAAIKNPPKPLISSKAK